jgi:hypothetical protein
MTDEFWEQTVQSDAKSRQFMDQTGGLPEIWTAAENLRLALDQTDREIAEAVMAARFPRKASDNMLTLIGHSMLSPEMQDAIEEEGEAGYKRATLQIRTRQIRQQLMGLIHELVEVRCDLVVSQTD